MAKNSTRIRLQSTFGLERAMASASCFDLWNRLSNDQIDGLESLHRARTDRWVLLKEETSNEVLLDMRATLAFFERAIDGGNYLLEVFEPAGLDALIGALDDLAVGEGTELGVVAEVLALYDSGALSSEPMGSDPRPVWDHIIAINQDDPDSLLITEADRDAFISYRHRRDPGLARRLARELEHRGASVFLDVRDLGLDGRHAVSDLEIKRNLEAALRRSRCTVFFETTAALARDGLTGVARTTFNWQAFEHRHSTAVLVVRPASRVVDLPSGRVGWTTFEELVELVLDGIRSRPQPVAEAGRTSDPDLSEVLADLGDLATRFFGDEIEIAPQAALALIPPEHDDPHFGQVLVFSVDRVMARLIRLDPICARVLHQEGIDAQSLLAASATLDRGRWGRPGSKRFDDTFGAPPGSPPEQVGSIELLRGVLSVAGQANSSTRESLELAHAATNDHLPKEARSADLNTRLNRVIARLEEPDLVAGDPGWLLRLDRDQVSLTPVVAIDRYLVEEMTADAVLLVEHWLGPLPASTEPGLAVADLDELRAFVSAYPEVALTFAPTGRLGHLVPFVHRSSTLAGGFELGSDRSARDLARCLADLADPVERGPVGAPAAPFDPLPDPGGAVLITQRDPMHRPLADGVTSHRQAALRWMPWLASYLRARDLPYGHHQR